MNFFKMLGIVFGITAFLKPFYMHVLPWDEHKFLEKTYSRKRPRWVFFLALLGIGAVGFTWYKELTTSIPYSIIISILFSLTLAKALILIFNYDKFRLWIAQLLSKNRSQRLIVIDIIVGLFGLALIILSFLLF